MGAPGEQTEKTPKYDSTRDELIATRADTIGEGIEGASTIGLGIADVVATSNASQQASIANDEAISDSYKQTSIDALEANKAQAIADQTYEETELLTSQMDRYTKLSSKIDEAYANYKKVKAAASEINGAGEANQQRRMMMQQILSPQRNTSALEMR